jgi:dTMP kinase
MTAMRPLLLAALLLQTFPAPAWSQLARAGAVRPASLPAPALARLAAPSLPPVTSLAPLALAPSILNTPAPALAPLSAPAAPSARLPAAPVAAAAPAAPVAAASLHVAGLSAGQVLSAPGNVVSDREAVDFTLGGARRAAAADAVPAALSAAIPSPLPPASRLPVPHAGPGSVPAPRPAPRLKAFLAGTLGVQVASNALQVLMPLTFLSLTGSAALTAGAVTVGAFADAAGTLLGGRLADRFGAKAVLLGTTVLRGAATAALVALAATGSLTLPLLSAAYLAESLARGTADTARSIVPAELSGGDAAVMKSVMARNQSFFEAGSLAGPFVAGGLILLTGGAGTPLALVLAPLAFTLVTAAYSFMPSSPAGRPAGAPAAAPEPKAKLSGWSLAALGSVALLSVYPLKGLLPAVFAGSVLGDPSAAAWLVGLFGVGGLAGSLAYGRLNGKVSLRQWLAAGAVGVGALALAFLQPSFWPAAAAVLVFSGFNGAARLALNAEIQSRAGPGRAGAAMAPARFTANLTGLGLRLLAGLAFGAAVGTAGAFWLIGAGLAAASLGLLALSARVTGAKAPAWAWLGAGLLAGLVLSSGHGVFAAPALGLAAMGTLGLTRRAPAAAPPGAVPSAAHGLPGRLIVVEGLDGSGKSTQLERLKERLEVQGLEVVLTTWNSSDLVSDAVKAAKKERTLTPKTFSLLHAADLADRLDKQILPALERGAVVLADRWFFTALARDSVRGMDPQWLRGLYAFAPKPDLTLYYRLPVETAIGRVLARSEGRLGLSEDFDEDPEEAAEARARRGLKYYEAGLDAKLAADPIENFTAFQTRVTASYDAQAAEFGFTRIDSSRDRDAIFNDTQTAARRLLGDLRGLRRAQTRAARNIFDKDPAGDAENIRRNYTREKRGVHFYYRNQLLPMQERFAQLMDMRMPRVLLHGSPHVDNYAKNNNGAAMGDWDRSRVGPYAWDLVRLMVSVSLRRKKGGPELLEKEALRQLKKGYLHGFRHPAKAFSEARQLKDVEPGEGERTVDEYLAAGGKWASEMRRNALPADDADVRALVASYARSRPKDRILEDYVIEEAGRGQGSMGLRGIYLVVLKPRSPRSKKERILLNFKAARTDPDTEWYKNPYGSELERMLAANALYAPGWEPWAGGATLGGVEYYVRGIPPLNAKIKKPLTHSQQEDFLYAVGTQLGRAHRLSLADGASAAELEAHLEAHLGDIAAAGLVIRDELVEAHARYLAKMKRDGLEPAEGGDEE